MGGWCLTPFFYLGAAGQVEVLESVRGDARVGEAVARLGGQAAERGASCAECLEVLVGDDAAEGEVDGVEVGESLDAGEGGRRRKKEEGERRREQAC